MFKFRDRRAGKKLKLSIIIPVFNGREKIGNCLDSLLKQTTRSVEIICVDDGSTDGTKEILESYEKKDERIEVIHLPDNLSALIARKYGFLHAKSDYVWFVDADDEVSESALEYLIEYLDKNNGVDIVHFNSEVLDYGAGNRRCIDKRQEIVPYMGSLKSDEILKSCFVDKKYTFNLWNKVFSRRVCEQAMGCVDEQKIPKGNDLYLYFLIAYYAETYEGINSPPLYCYCYGNGSTGHDFLTFQQFQAICEEYCVSKALENYFGGDKAVGVLERALVFVLFRVLNDCIVAWKRRLPKEDKKAGFKYLLNKIGPINVVSAIHHTYYDELDAIYEDICDLDIFQCRKVEERNIAFYVPGDSRLSWYLIENIILQQQKDYPGLLVITDDLECEKFFSDKFKVQCIPVSDKGNQVFHERMKSFQYISEHDQVDALFYVNYRSSSILYDVLLWKSFGKKVNVINCEFMFANMAFLRKGDAFLIQAIRMADSLYTFYPNEIEFWKDQNVNVMPVRLHMICEENDLGEAGFHILWVGEFQNPQYNFYDSIEVMERLIKQVPSARLHVACLKYTEEKINAFWQRAEQFGVKQYISVYTDIEDLRDIFVGVNACMMTSSFEICPTGLIFAEYYKIPVFSYREPVLTEFQEQTEICAVSFRDYQGMADCLAALKAGDRFISIESENQRLVETILYHYKQGVLKYRRQTAQLNKLVKELKRIEDKYQTLKVKYENIKP